MTPSCCKSPRVSVSSQCSTLLPPTMRLMSMQLVDVCLPVGGMPRKGPVYQASPHLAVPQTEQNGGEEGARPGEPMP